MIELYKRLKKLSADQSRAIKAEDLELLEEMIQQKQELIKKIDSAKSAPESAKLSPSETAAIAKLVEEQMILDKDNEEELILLIDKLKNNMTEVIKGKAAAKSYSPETATGPRFFDAAG